MKQKILSNRLPSTEVLDFDKDEHNEIIFSDETFGLFIKPSYGGAIFEFDFKPSNMNLTNTIARRYDAYHKKIDLAVVKK